MSKSSCGRGIRPCAPPRDRRRAEVAALGRKPHAAGGGMRPNPRWVAAVRVWGLVRGRSGRTAEGVERAQGARDAGMSLEASKKAALGAGQWWRTTG
jgi:hypothetical protein